MKLTPSMIKQLKEPVVQFNTKLIDLKQNIECTEVSSVKGDYTIDCITNKFYRLKFDIKNNSGKLKIDLYI